MESAVYTLKRTSHESLAELQDKLLKEFGDMGSISYNHIEENENVEVLLLVCEKYYFRNGSMAALTLQCINDHKEQKAILVGTGGGSGIANISWGANANFANKAKEILNKYGFSE